jgi:hypothetical protein
MPVVLALRRLRGSGVLNQPEVQSKTLPQANKGTIKK